MDMELHVTVLERPLRCRWTRLDDGAQFLVTGGDREHVGAVSVAEADGGVRTMTFPGHKDQFISEPWAIALAARLGRRVCVTCGVHYDNLSKAGIETVLAAAQALLSQVLERVTA